mgnify:CR=1 FL=1
MARIGSQVCSSFPGSALGCGTDAWNQANDSPAAPLSARGCFRVSEDGRLRLDVLAADRLVLGIEEVRRQNDLPHAKRHNERRQLPPCRPLG